MIKYNVECGTLRSTCIAPDKQSACLEALVFAKETDKLSNEFVVWPVGDKKGGLTTEVHLREDILNEGCTGK